jgi:FkbM family methyltransferase
MLHGQGGHPYAAASIEFLGETTTLFTFAPETDELSAIVHQSKNFYEFYILEFLCLLGEQNVILDIGANFGNHTLFFSRFLKHESIYAFEPIKDNYEILKKNCPGVFCIRRAVSSTPTEKIMAVDRNFMGRAYVHGEGCQGSFQRIEKVSSIRLDDFYYGDVSLIKIDVEGHELDVLKGGQSLLRQHMPNILIESCDVKAVDYLQTQGYTPLLLFPGRNFFMAPTGSETHRWVHGLPDEILNL